MEPAKTGPFGILARLSWLAVTLFGLYQIIFDWPSLIADTEIFAVESAVTGRLEGLTDLERDLLAAIARGSSDVEISAELAIHTGMVKLQVRGMLTKLGLRDRVQAVVFAYESGIAKPGDHDIGH